MMKKNIVRLIVFVVVLIGIITGVQWTVDNTYNRLSKNKFNLIAEHKADYEIMVWGSSIARLQIDPSKMQEATMMSCYNEGWFGTFFAQYEGLIKEYMSYQKKCKCMVIACAFNEFNRNKLITQPDLFLSHLSNDNIYRSLHNMEPDKMFRARYIPGYKLVLLNKKFYMPLFTDNKGLDKNSGYLPVDYAWQVEAANDTPFIAPFQQEVYDDFKKTINSITAKGIEVILINTPVYSNGYKLIKNADEIKSKISALTHNNDRIHYIDYTTDTMCGNRDYFYNNSHLKLHGATIFSEKLAQQILNILLDKKVIGFHHQNNCR